MAKKNPQIVGLAQGIHQGRNPRSATLRLYERARQKAWRGDVHHPRRAVPPLSEALIANALDTTAPDMWPERYTPEALANYRHWRRLVNVLKLI